MTGVAGLFPYCDDEDAADEGGGETRPLNAFTRVGGPGVVGVGVTVFDLFVMAAGALFNKLMIVELPLLLLLAITLLPTDDKLLPGGEVQTFAAAAAVGGKEQY